MASLVCKYCGAYINDTDEVCKECGATNEHYKRVSDGTPRTIEELKSWYKARKLPPEETTRFFIGRDIREPRAFGIYEDRGKFIVYKNKANGERAIRYQGRDEAYAVNEIYLKLKEEILNQKKHNERKAVADRPNRPTNQALSDAEYEYYQRQAQRNSVRNRKRSPVSKMVLFVLGIMLLPHLLLAMFFIGVKMNVSDTSDTFVDDYIYSYDYDTYYIDEENNLYYLDKYDGNIPGFIWWTYNEESAEWEHYQNYTADNDEVIIGPEQVRLDTPYQFFTDYVDALGLDWLEYRERDIRKSRAFIDAGNHETPMDQYYYYNDTVYYFLDDWYGSYGTGDTTGWYVYENDTWSYYCAEDDKDKLGEDLWYNCSDYWVYDIYDDAYTYDDEYSAFWNVTNFEDTSWYAESEANYEAYQDWLNSPPSYSNNDSYDYDYDYDWGSDSDWDWDSGSDWDSGWSDWDSDW